jgi:hypothetical protein
MKALIEYKHVLIGGLFIIIINILTIAMTIVLYSSLIVAKRLFLRLNVKVVNTTELE